MLANGFQHCVDRNGEGVALSSRRDELSESVRCKENPKMSTGEIASLELSRANFSPEFTRHANSCVCPARRVYPEVGRGLSPLRDAPDASIAPHRDDINRYLDAYVAPKEFEGTFPPSGSVNRPVWVYCGESFWSLRLVGACRSPKGCVLRRSTDT